MEFSKTGNKILPVLFAFFVLCFYVYNLSPTIFVGDSPELLASAATLGVAHPPGYPVYVVATNFLTKIFPFGGFAYRANFAGAFLIFSVLIILSAIIADFPSLAYFAFAPVALASALSGEVFALNLFFAAVITLLLKRGGRGNTKAAAFVFGLACANHQTIVLMLPAVLFLLFKRKQMKPKFALELFLLSLIGFSANLFLLVRASGSPPLNWGNPSTFGNFLRVILRKDYGTFSLYGSDYGLRISSLWEEFAIGFEFAGALFIVSPLAYILKIKKQNDFSHFLFLCFLFTGPVFYFISGISSPNINFVKAIMERFFLLPSFFLIPLFAAVSKNFRRRKILDICVLALAASFLGSAKTASLRNFFSLSDFSDEILREVPADGSLVIEKGAVGDDLIFALAYKKWAQRVPAPEIFTYYGSVFPSVYGERASSLPPAERQINKLRFFSSPGEKYFFALAKNQVPFADFTLNGFVWGKFFDGTSEPFWRLSRMRNYRVRSLEILYYYFRLLKNPDGKLAEVCEYYGGDIDWLLTNLGTVWADMGEPGRAKNCYGKSLRLNPRLAVTYNNLGVLFFNEENWSAAAENFKRASLLAGDDVRFYNLGLAYEKLNRQKDASLCFRKSLAFNPLNFKSINELGLIKMREG
ncbi:MAG: DUF2723 domain-containing protein, partial [Elusimicrobia bacterium]|nr:DUF2723 domain-containing protein [Elusimicrobiota bacterium]